MFKISSLLMLITRILEFLGIITTIFLMFKGYKLRYVYIVGGVVVLSILISILGLFFKDYFVYLAVGDLVVTAFVLGGVILYVTLNPEKAKDFTPSDNIRCPVCNVYIINEDGLCTMRIGNYTYYFDSCDHMIKMMKEIDFLLSRRNFPKGEVKDMYVKTKDTGRWKKLEDVYIVEDKGVFYAYEKPPENGNTLDLKEVLDHFKNRLNSEGS